VPKVVITLPAYRAERTLARTVADIPPEVADLLILVDDASPDNTVALARELGIDVYVHSQNRGYGGNQKTCYTEALRSGADVVVLLHPDYQYEPKAVPLLIAPLLAGEADMTFGSRFAGLGDPIGGGMPLYRYVGNRLTTVLENMMLGSRFTEMHSGLRAYTRRCLLSLPFLRYSDDFVFDSQMLVDAVTSGQRVVEVPIPTRYTEVSSSIGISRSFRYVAGSLGYCARRASKRGRRGRRYAVAHPERAVPYVAPDAETVASECNVCGAKQQAVASPGGARQGTGGGILQCTRCGFASLSRIEMRRESSLEAADGSPSNDGLLVGPLILDTVGGYLVAGDDLLAVGSNAEVISGLAADLGWRAEASVEDVLPSPRTEAGATARRGRSPARMERRRFDVVVLFDFLDGNPVDALRRARSLLDPNGALAVVVRQPTAAGMRGSVVAPRATEGGYFFTAGALWTALRRAGFLMVEWIPARPVAPGGLGTHPPRPLIGRRPWSLLRGGRRAHGSAEAVEFGLAIARSADVTASSFGEASQAVAPGEPTGRATPPGSP
jgi:Glycosyl transferase family 2